MHTAQVVFLILIWLVVMGAGVAGVQVMARMTDEVNRKRSAKDALWPYGSIYAWVRVNEIRREYRALYPDGTFDRRLRSIYRLQIAAGVAFVLFLVLFLVSFAIWQ